MNLHDAVGNNKIDEFIKSLDGYTGSINAEKNGLTPLQVAVKKGNSDIVALLLERGANVNATAGNVPTPLQVALQQKPNVDMYVIGLLLENGADVNIVNEKCQTPLHLAVETDTPHVVALLLEKRPDANAKDSEGKTPLHRAILPDSNGVVVGLLLDGGANIHAEDKDGKTPLDLAIERKIDPIVNLLIRHKNFDVKHKNYNRYLEKAKAFEMKGLFDVNKVKVKKIREVDPASEVNRDIVAILKREAVIPFIRLT